MTGIDSNGNLTPCPDKPNCVSSQSASQYPQEEPMPLNGRSASDAITALVAIVNNMPRTKIITQTDTYLHAEFRSRIFRFVDDLEFVIDEENGVVHFKSASRTGYSDLNVNPDRIKTIRALFN